MLEIRNLTIKIQNKTLIENLTMVVNKNDKIAIIGEEGNGKSTLLKAIYDPTSVSYATIMGTIDHKKNRFGYLEQVLSAKEDELVFQYLFTDENNYYEMLNEFYRLLKVVQLDDRILEKKMKMLSGGEKVKLQLLRILLDDPDIFLFDEPTNDLDIETLEWLERFIINCEKPILYISHDEYLLGKTANRILHLELTKKKTQPIYTYSAIKYEEYVMRRYQNLKKQTQIAKKEKKEAFIQEQKLTQIKNKVEHQLRTISRSDPHGAQLLKKKMKTIKAQEKRFAQKEMHEIPDVEEAISLSFAPVFLPKTKVVLDLHIKPFMINGNFLAKSIDLTVKGNEHVVILGKNGSGKTTLIKEILKQLNEHTDIQVGYMSQNYQEILNEEETPIQYLQITGSQEETSLHRSYLGNLNFTQEEMTGKIKFLSGGSKAKLIFMKLIVGKYNVLLLDEPTRNISPLSNPIIRNLLKQYEGCIISISHDRKYVEEVGMQVYQLTKEGLQKSI